MIRGEVVYIYAFDVAHEIRTAQITSLLPGLGVSPIALRADRSMPKGAFHYRPLGLELPRLHRWFRGVDVRVAARIYQVGVITLQLRVPFAVETLLDLMPFHAPDTVSGESQDALAERLRQEVLQKIAPALVRPHPSMISEAYTTFCITEIDGVRDAQTWFETHKNAAAGLLTETDPARLSDIQIQETLRIHRAFERGDYVVIDWDAALVIDFTGYVEDVLYVLEVAVVQAEEFKVIDTQLDRYLDKAYEVFGTDSRESARTRRRVLSEVRGIRLDAARLTDELTNISKFFGDWYLARVFVGARNRFHLNQWHDSVIDRLGYLDQLYSVVQTEANERRMLWLETVIVLLFIADLVSIVWMKA